MHIIYPIYAIYSSSKVQLYQDIRLVKSFYFYCHYFHIQFNYCFKNHLLLQAYNNLLVVQEVY